jgi:hypothetical protein
MNPTNEPGKYDAPCEAVQRELRATLVALIVLGGVKGSGFSVSTTDLSCLAGLPGMLRHTADQIEAQLHDSAQN